MLVKFLKSCAGLSFSYAAGETADVPSALGRDLIRAGYAEEVKKVKKTKGEADVDAQ